MKSFLRIFGIVLLIINGVSALSGGSSLMILPSGDLLELPLSLLDGSIFKSYFFPGMALFIINEVLSIVSLSLLILNHKNQGPFLFMQGFFSSLFIITEIAVIHSFHWLQLVFGTIAILIFVCGFGLLFQGKSKLS